MLRVGEYLSSVILRVFVNMGTDRNFEKILIDLLMLPFFKNMDLKISRTRIGRTF